MSAKLERQARDALEAATAEAAAQIRRMVEEVEQRRSATAEASVEQWKKEFEQARTGVREDFLAEFAARQQELLLGLKSEFETRSAAGPRTDGRARPQGGNSARRTRGGRPRGARPGQARLAASASNRRWGSRNRRGTNPSSRRSTRACSLSPRNYRSARPNVVPSDPKASDDRLAEVRQPLAQMSAEARETLGSVRSAFEQEVARARASLSEIRHSANRMRDYSSQLEAASHDTLNELDRRIGNILKAQTEEMNRRVESLTAGVPDRLTAAVNSLARQLVEQSATEFESKFQPHFKRVPELLSELSSQEVHIEQGLRLHREHLRQVAETYQRDVASELAATVSALHSDFELARREALAKWNEELDAAGVRASHAAAESIGRASEWFEQEARARLQVHVEQTLAASGIAFEEKTAQAARNFALQLEGRSTAHLARSRARARSVGERTGRPGPRAVGGDRGSRGCFVWADSTRHYRAGNRPIHEHEPQRTRGSDRGSRAREGGVCGKLEASAGTSIERFREQMAAQLDASATEGRGVLAAEYSSTLDRYRDERDVREKQWVEDLEILSNKATEKYQDRLETGSDSWMVSSVRRLNEQGKNAIESLVRSADQALRDSCSKVFESFAEMLRGRAADAARAPFAPEPSREISNAPEPHNQPGAYRANG